MAIHGPDSITFEGVTGDSPKGDASRIAIGSTSIPLIPGVADID